MKFIVIVGNRETIVQAKNVNEAVYTGLAQLNIHSLENVEGISIKEELTCDGSVDAESRLTTLLA